MIDRHAWRQCRAASLGTLRTIGAAIDGFCARVNAGLALVAAVLALVVVMAAAVRVPEIIDQTLPPIAFPDAPLME